jgi:Protein of unknown function (DUF2442)
MDTTRTVARITSAVPLEGFRLRLTFTDGLLREVDLSHDLWGQLAEPLQDPDYFRQVGVDRELGTQPNAQSRINTSVPPPCPRQESNLDLPLRRLGA